MAKVSISVAIYNVSKYIEKCVRSLYEQTLDDIEILLVDDCTPDDSMEIAMRVLEEYPHRKDQVRVIHHEHNMGIALTKKDGYTLATGDYVAVIDGDDYIDVHYAEQMYNKAISEHSDMVICDWYYVSAEGKSVGTIFQSCTAANGDDVRDATMNRLVSPVLWCKMISRTVANESGIIWPQNGLGEDTVLSSEFVYYSKRISHVQTPLYYYTIHPESISNLHTKTAEETLVLYKDFINNVEIMADFYQRENISEKYALGLFVNKLRSKNWLRYYVHKRKYRKLWLRTYPEINKTLLMGGKFYKPTIKNWIWFVLLLLGLTSIPMRRKYYLFFIPKCKTVI